MKFASRLVVALSLFIIFAGCATRVGSSHKLSNYDGKLKEISVIYKIPKADNELMTKKLERYNFQHLDEYLTKTVPQTFALYGLQASYYTQLTSHDKPLSTGNQILFIKPSQASTTKVKDLPLSTGPSLDPVRVYFEAYVFDRLINKEIWSGNFSIVVGGLLYGPFSEKIAASFLNDIAGKLQSDGLVEKNQL